MHTLLKAFTPAIALIFTALSVQADDWQLLYSVNKDGTAQGDKQALIDAVRAGQEIRVGWGVFWQYKDGSEGGVEHVADSKFLTIFEGDLYAQVDSILPQRPRPGQGEILLNSPNGERWTGMVNTKGTFQSFVSSKTEPEHHKISSFWYVKGDRENALPAPERLK